jgi:hypothetical protein
MGYSIIIGKAVGCRWKVIKMRSLERNKQTIYYALYDDKIPVLDEYGNDTGQTQPGYHNPVKLRARVSPNKGEANTEAFGLTADYDRVISTTDTLPLTETSILWVDTIPLLENDGSTKTPHDYAVKKVAPDLNNHQYAIKKVVQGA